MEINTNLTEKGQRDYLLIQRALRDGDQKAYAELLQHYRDSLYFMMLKMTNNPYDADDLTIEAFGKAFKNWISTRLIMHSVPGCLKSPQTTASIFKEKPQKHIVVAQQLRRVCRK